MPEQVATPTETPQDAEPVRAEQSAAGQKPPVADLREHAGAYSFFRSVAAHSSGGQEPPPEQFAPIFSNSDYANPVNDAQRGRVLGSMQQLYGNRYVQRMLSSNAPGGKAPAADAKANGKGASGADAAMHGPEAGNAKNGHGHEAAEHEAAKPGAQHGAPLPKAKGNNLHALMESRLGAGRGAAQGRGKAPVQREVADAPATAPVTPTLEGSTGHPLDTGTRAVMEPVVGVDLGQVRVHTDAPAEQMARDLNANAFTTGHDIYFAPGQYSPSDTTGRGLVAHELTHVVQQSHGTVSPGISQPGDAHERQAEAVQSAVTGGGAGLVPEAPSAMPALQRDDNAGSDDEPSGIVGRVLRFFAEKANLIPGFRLFTVIIGVNPIDMRSVPATAANVIEGIVELAPGGALITQALETYGVFDKIGNWAAEQFKALGLAASAFIDALGEFVDSLGITDIFDPGDVWDRAKRIFSEPVVRIKDFLVGLVTGILGLIKDAVLMPLAKLAEGTRGWPLLTAVLGKNPITGEEVPRNADTLIGGFMILIGEEETWNNLKKANALGRAWAWFQSALGTLLDFVSQIPELFIAALKSLELIDIVVITNAFAKVGAVFGGFIVNFVTWAGDAVWQLLQIIFEVLAPSAIPYLKKVGASFKKILKDPISFVRNLVAAGKLGFLQFASNIGDHLKNSFIEWLTGSLQGVYIPKALEFREIVKFVLSVLGLTWPNIRQKLVKVVGETAVKAMETGFSIVVTLVTQGPAAAWEQIKEQLSGLQDMVMQGIMSFVTETIVKKAIEKVVGLLVPGGAFIEAIISIYDTVTVLIAKLQKIIQVVMAFLDSMMEIVSGAIGGAASKIENTLAGLLTLAINFLAGFLGLGGIAAKVMDIINTKVRQPVDKALDKVIDWIVTMAKKLFAKAFGKEDKKDERTPEQKQADLDKAIEEADVLHQSPDATDAQIKKGLLSIKEKYKMASLELVVDSEDKSKETVHVEGEINPKKSSKGFIVVKDDKIGQVKIPRPGGFRADTAEALNPNRLDLVKSSLDRRHVVSSKDMAEHYETNLSGQTLQGAKDKLNAKLGAHNIPPVKDPPDGDAILDRAKALHREFFNDTSNLFLGDSSENRAIGRSLDPKHPAIGLDQSKLDDHVKDIEQKYAIGPFTPTPAK